VACGPVVGTPVPIADNDDNATGSFRPAVSPCSPPRLLASTTLPSLPHSQFGLCRPPLPLRGEVEDGISEGAYPFVRLLSTHFTNRVSEKQTLLPLSAHFTSSYQIKLASSVSSLLELNVVADVLAITSFLVARRLGVGNSIVIVPKLTWNKLYVTD
jgi:hypothetical protein